MTPAAEYARRLLKLHRLWMTGQDASPQAEVVRESMDELWPQLSDQDAAELREYAAELNDFSRSFDALIQPQS